jgi:hypothetical protein
MQDWRAQNPRATFAEIEDAVDEKLADLRVKMMEDVALESRARDIASNQGGILCPICGGALKDRGKHVRKLTTQNEKQIHLERSYGYCPTCRVGFFPLDEELEVAPQETFTPRVLEGMARLATWMPFRQAKQQLEFFTKVEVNEGTIRHTTEQAGAMQVELQDRRVAEIQATCEESPEGPELQMMSTDGCFIQLVGGEWKEVKTVALGVVGKAVEERGEVVVHTEELTYYSRMSDSKKFTQGALVETHERGVEKAGKVCAVTDGAEWIQDFVDMHRADAIRILDFAHAMEYVDEVGKAIVGAGLADVLREPEKQSDHPTGLSCSPQAESTKASKRKKTAPIPVSEGTAQAESTKASKHEPAHECEKRWEERQAHELKYGQAARVLQEIERLMDRVQNDPQALETIRKSYNYLKARESLMDYASFQASGYPIGSGCVESANKLVVESRMKSAGMRWADEHVNPMLALRNISCSNRWKESWKHIRHHCLVKVQAGRALVSASRLQLLASEHKETGASSTALPQEHGSLPPHVLPVVPTCSPSPDAVQVIPPDSLVKQEASPARTTRPAANHPWRRRLLPQRAAS